MPKCVQGTVRVVFLRQRPLNNWNTWNKPASTTRTHIRCAIFASGGPTEGDPNSKELKKYQAGTGTTVPLPQVYIGLLFRESRGRAGSAAYTSPLARQPNVTSGPGAQVVETVQQSQTPPPSLSCNG